MSTCLPVYLCLPVSTYVYLCLPVSTYVYLCLPVSTCVYLRLPVSTCVYLCLPVSTYVYLCLPMSTYVYLCLPVSTYDYLCPPVSACVYLCLFVSTCVYLCLPTSTYVYLRLRLPRFLQQGVMVKEFYVDNCCAWRSKLQSVFGPELRVPLDIFHAVKRVGDKIPKRHELRTACMEDLQMVFRNPSDRGTDRTMTTPAPGSTGTQTY